MSERGTCGPRRLPVGRVERFICLPTDGNIGSDMNESNEERGLEARITPRLIDALYTEAMVLADEARSYFDEAGRDDRQSLEPFARVGFACESLKVTTRIMHIVAWLLTQRAVESGEIRSADGRRPERRLGHANDSDPLVVEQLPEAAQRLIDCQRRPLFAGPAARRRAADRRAGAKPGARADGPARARLHLEPRRLTALGSRIMRPFTFNPGPRLISGDGSARRLADLLPAGPCLFVTDRDVLALGLTDACRAALEESGREIILFDAVEADPSKETLLAAVELGGVMTSLMSSASAAAARWMSPSSPLICSDRATISTTIWGVDMAKGQRLPLALVPTTAGTGSEATPISVITCDGGVKLAVNARPLIADWAVLDASLTLGLPRACHRRDRHRRDGPCGRGLHFGAAQESRCRMCSRARRCGCCRPICSRPATSRAMSRRARRCCSARISPASPSPMRRSPASMRWLIRSAGIYHLPHGLSNALMLRVVLQHNSEAARELYAELAPILDAGMRRAGEPGALRDADRAARPAGRGQRA